MALNIGHIVKILVISDIHYSEENKSDVDIVTDALIDAIKDVHINYIIVNGDIVNDGQKSSFKSALGFFEKLMKETKVPSENIIFSVGNHDLDRHKFKASFSKNLIPTELKKCQCEGEEKTFVIPDIQKRNKLLKEKSLVHFKPVFEEYINFLKDDLNIKKFDSGFPNTPDWEWASYLNGYRKFEDDNLIISFLNSSWYHYHNRASGSLVLGDEIVTKHLDTINNDKKERDIHISCLHHGSNWLAWSENFTDPESFQANYSKIAEYSDLLISSHEHASTFQSPTFFKSRTLLVPTGAVHQNPTYPNSFKILNINVDKRLVTVDDYFGVKYERDYFFQLNKFIKLGRVNTNYEKRVFPLKLNLSTKVSKEWEFWEENAIHNEEVSVNRDISDFIIRTYEDDYNIEISFKESIDEFCVYHNEKFNTAFILFDVEIFDIFSLQELINNNPFTNKFLSFIPFFLITIFNPNIERTKKRIKLKSEFISEFSHGELSDKLPINVNFFPLFIVSQSEIVTGKRSKYPQNVLTKMLKQ